jgi:hypothetical protein
VQHCLAQKQGCHKKLTAMIFISLMAVTNLLLQQEIQPLKLAKRCAVLSKLCGQILGNFQWLN